MASRLFLISFISLILLHGCTARRNDLQQQQECNFDSMRALQPISTIEAEGGKTEFWNPDTQQFRCAGVAFLKHTIRRKSLLVPSYANSVLMVYVEEGKGFYSVVLPGCPETFQSPQEQSGERMRDRNQKIENFKKGDILIFQAGVTHWMYNNGDQDVKLVVMFDTTNRANQLDSIPQRFYVLGNPQGRQQGQQQQCPLLQQFQGESILKGFADEMLTAAFKMNKEMASKLKGQGVKEGHIITIEKELQVTRPEQQQQQQQDNGLEETSCSQNIRINIDKIDQADIFNPQAGHLTSLNSHHLPILNDVRLSAERGHLKMNAMMGPFWVLNAHSIMYPTDGEARIQIVNNQGRLVFDERLQKGQLVLIPQNFAVMIQAGNRGFQWVAFKTNDNAMITPIAGRASVYRGLPVSILSNILQISEQEASKLKYSNAETIMFAPQTSQGKTFTRAFQSLLEV
ncbi:11S globulin seed storage protein Ana o 2.0101-like [Apium graveolens]|uniref:11S globulin seed storage protein Ana o 2.0101-like n=1 Tax=Apium graveolens TaxID=4045 RepID=UPI003D7A7866